MSYSPVHTASTPITLPASLNANVVLENVPCEASVYVGAIVHMLGTGIAQNSIGTSLSTSNMIGIVESKSSSVLCNIRVTGVTGANYAGLDVTKEYYLSDTVAGGIQNTPPTTSGSILMKIGQPFSTAEMLVTKGQRTVRL